MSSHASHFGRARGDPVIRHSCVTHDPYVPLAPDPAIEKLLAESLPPEDEQANATFGRWILLPLGFALGALLLACTAPFF